MLPREVPRHDNDFLETLHVNGLAFLSNDTFKCLSHLKDSEITFHFNVWSFLCIMLCASKLLIHWTDTDVTFSDQNVSIYDFLMYLNVYIYSYKYHTYKDGYHCV